MMWKILSDNRIIMHAATAPFVVVGVLNEQDGVAHISDETEEAAAEMCDWERETWGEAWVDIRFLMEVKT